MPIIGALIAVFLLSALYEWALFKRVIRSQATAKVCAVAAAYLTGSVARGFGEADGGPFMWGSFAVYLLPAIALAAYGYQKGAGLDYERPERRDNTLEDTFR